MKTISQITWLRAVLFVALLTSVTACDGLTGTEQEAQTSADELTAMTAYLARELSLSDTQEQNVRAVMARHEERMHEPGFLWYLAADLQERLTDEQKERLFALAEQRGPRPGGQGAMHRPGGFGPGRPGAGSFGPGRDGMHPPGGGPLFEDLLTDEQKAAIEERRAEREAEREARREQERAVMIDVLGLSDTQIAGLDALREEQQAARDALREQVEAGALSIEEAAEALAALREAEHAALDELLDDRPFEIVRIHQALAIAGPKRGGPGQGHAGQGGPGQGGPRNG